MTTTDPSVSMPTMGQTLAAYNALRAEIAAAEARGDHQHADNLMGRALQLAAEVRRHRLQERDGA